MIAHLGKDRQKRGEALKVARVCRGLAILACIGSLTACSAQDNHSARSATGYEQNAAATESLEQRVARLERDLANLRIDYSVVRPEMERIASPESGLEARISAIESAFGPMTASIPAAARSMPAYVPPAATAFPTVGIHLASYRDTENVERGWQDLRTAHSDLLADMELKIVDYRSSHDGLYHRLVAGPIDPAIAESRCASLKDRGVWCQVVTLGR